VQLDDAAHDRQTEPRAVAGWTILAAEVAIEDVRKVTGGDAAAVVDDRNAKVLWLRSQLERDASTRP
jgi:hypothetical protein